MYKEYGIKLYIKKEGDVAVVRIPGEFLDASNYEEFMREITPLLFQTPRVVLDIGGLRIVDSSGLGAFAYCLRKTQEAKGGLRIACVPESIQPAFELVHIERLIGIHETVEEAVSDLSSEYRRIFMGSKGVDAGPKHG